jgi:hypothetical protein
MTQRFSAFILLLALAIAAPRAGSGQGRSSFPTRLETYMTNTAKLTAMERQRLFRGEAVTRLLDADESKEVAILGAVWIDAPMRRYIEAVKDIETFERGGGFKVTRRISSPPRFEDFRELRVPDEDLQDLRRCKVGDCEVKVAASALNRFHSEINWNAPNARASAMAWLQRLAHEYATSYLKGGDAELAVYRDGARPTFVAQEFREMTGAMPELTTHMPNLRRYLLGFPKVSMPEVSSFLYWQETEFGLKPVIRLNHLAIRETAEDAVVINKMLYASHYFWTGIEIRALVPDPARGSGFWFVTVNRSRSDGLAGFTGRIIRGRVRSEVEKGILTALQSTKQMLERAQ